MRKKIGIYGWSTGDLSFGVTKTYLNWISSFGEPVIIVPENKYQPNLDLLVLSGGLDINPSSYGDFPGFSTSSIDVFKQHVYDNCLPNYLENNIPVFGICLGLQQLAVKFDSKLEQDLIFHKQSPARWQKAHDVIVTKDAANLALGKYMSKLEVNSHHHQGVVLNKLGEDLIPLALATNEETLNPKTDIVESFIHKNRPVAGCQWHPEEWYDTLSTRLVNILLGYKD